MTPVGAVVLGASRSGTSLVAGSLVAAGFYVGADEELMPANRGNPAGYWENVAVCRANEELLDTLDGSWFAPPSNEAQLSARLRATHGLQALLDRLRRQAGERPLVIKDPRIGVLLKIWGPLIEDLLHPVLAVRHPLEVALSLKRRDGTPTPFAQASWEAHTSALLAYLHGRSVTVVRYEDLLAGREAVTSFVATVSGRLHPSLAGRVDPDAAPLTVRPALRHNDAAALDADGYLTGRQAELWRFVGSLPAGHQVLHVPPALRRMGRAALTLTRHEEERLRERAELAEQISRNAEHAIATAEQRAAIAEQRAAEAEERAASAAQRTADAEARLAGVTGSNSWRITAPLRAIAHTARSLLERTLAEPSEDRRFSRRRSPGRIRPAVLRDPHRT